MLRRPYLPFLFVFLVAVGCGPRSGGGGPRVDVGAYPALRWAPADVSYGGVFVRADGALGATRDLIDAFTIVADFELGDLDRSLTNYLGVNPLSVDDLRAAGVDTSAGGVVFSQGFSPTFVFRLADPVAMQARIDAQRERAGQGAAVGVAVRDNVEVFTALADRQLHTHWAIDGNWMWVHFEIVDEHEPEGGWFDASRAAAGALAADPDFAWARGQTERVQPGAALFGLVRPHRLAARIAAAADKPRVTTCVAVVTPPRAAVAMDAAGGVAEGHVIVDTGGGAAAIDAMTLPVPSGWAAARAQPAAAAEWNLDLVAMGRWYLPCDDDLAEAAAESGARAGRGFITRFDPEELAGVGGVAVDITHRRMIDRMLDITGRSMFEKRKKFGPLDGVRLDAPMFPAVDYVITKDRAMAGLGDGVLAQMIGDGGTTPGVLAAIEIRPTALPAEAWDFLFEQVAGIGRDEFRANMVRRLMRWKYGVFELTRDGDLLHLRARGERP